MSVARRASAALATSAFVLSICAHAHAQNAQAIKACLLFRSAVQCGIADDQPYFAPGDSLSLFALRPHSWRTRSESQKEGVAHGDVGADGSIEAHRQIYTLPLDWQPMPNLSFGGAIPVVHQTIADEQHVTLGDVAGTAQGEYTSKNGELDARFFAAAKFATGNKDLGTGSGTTDLVAFGDANWEHRWIAVTAHVAYRHNGPAYRGDLLQGSAAADGIVDLSEGIDIAFHARALMDFETAAKDGTRPARHALHAVVGLYPRWIGIGLFYALILIPVVKDTTLPMGLTVNVGFEKPF